MRILVAGATGVIGMELVPLLSLRKHDVIAGVRSAKKVDRFDDYDVETAVFDVLDAEQTRAAVVEAKPDLIVNQVTALPNSLALLPAKILALNKVRRVGGANLVAAADAVGARVLSQSIAFDVPAVVQKGVDALEAATLGAGGTVARYGQFYGPGTWFKNEPKKGPVVHIDEAARLTLKLLDADPGVYVVTDAGVEPA